jgi:hypothetical protein
VTLPQSSPVQVKIGNTLEVVLKMGQQWALLLHNDAILRLDHPAGYEDVSRQSCVWHFTALASGQANVQFSATPLCIRETRCTASVRVFDLTVEVSAK